MWNRSRNFEHMNWVNKRFGRDNCNETLTYKFGASKLLISQSSRARHHMTYRIQLAPKGLLHLCSHMSNFLKWTLCFDFLTKRSNVDAMESCDNGIVRVIFKKSTSLYLTLTVSYDLSKLDFWNII
jgi:hypothetical protein